MMWKNQPMPILESLIFSKSLRRKAHSLSKLLDFFTYTNIFLLRQSRPFLTILFLRWDCPIFLIKTIPINLNLSFYKHQVIPGTFYGTYDDRNYLLYTIYFLKKSYVWPWVKLGTGQVLTSDSVLVISKWSFDKM